jgi:hypothetical protein
VFGQQHLALAHQHRQAHAPGQRRAVREDRVERVGLKFTGLGERLISGDKR